VTQADQPDTEQEREQPEPQAPHRVGLRDRMRGERGPELDVPPTGRTLTNLHRAERSIT
jgi:hypothetical protein